MDLNVNALLSATYLIPIAITLRKIYAPCFETPEPIAAAVAKLEAPRRDAGCLAEVRPEAAIA